MNRRFFFLSTSVSLLLSCGGLIAANSDGSDDSAAGQGDGGSSDPTNAGDASSFRSGDGHDSLGKDANQPIVDGAFGDGSVSAAADSGLAPCYVPGNIFHLYAKGADAAAPELRTLTTATGSWSAQTNGTLMRVFALAPDMWEFQLISVGGDDLEKGTHLFVTGSMNRSVNLALPGFFACGGGWNGQVIIDEIDGDGDYSLTRFRASFDLSCADGQTAVGCVGYGN